MDITRVAAIAVAMAVALIACVGDNPDLAAAKNEVDAGAASDAAGVQQPDAERATDATPDAPAEPLSTFCKQQLKDVGSAVLFCADFDEPSEPLAAYLGGAFTKNAFEKEELLGGSATLVSGSLVTKKPAQGTADSVGARYLATVPLADVLKGLRVEVDMLVTRPSPHNPLTIFGLMHGGSKFIADFEDNNGNPSLNGVEPGGTKQTLRATVPIATAWHVEIVINPSSLTTYTLTGALNGTSMKDSTTAVTSKTVQAELDQTLILPVGILSGFSGEGETTIQYDNLLVRTLR